MDTVETKTLPITITAPAAAAVLALIAERNLEGYALRMYISGGGCSGYQYGMALDDRSLENDTVFEAHGVRVVVDEMSLQYLHGATIDFVENESGKGFKISNPNPPPSASCSSSDCGGCCG